MGNWIILRKNKTLALLITVLAILLFSTITQSQGKAETGENLTPDSWTNKKPLPIAAGALEAATVNGKIYVFGGNCAFEYDPTADSWATKTPMPTPATDFGIAVCNNKIYCIGGTTGFTAEKGYPALSSNQVYDPAMDTWENKTEMPTPRAFLQASVVGDQIFLIGGKPSDIVQDFTVPHIPHYGNQISNAVEVYNATSDEWTSKTAMPTAAAFYVSAVFNNKIYVVNYNSNQVYDAQSDSWSQAAPPISSDIESGEQTTGQFAPLRLYVFGENTTQSYNPVADYWSLCVEQPSSRFGFATADLNDTFFVIGGYIKYPPPYQPSHNEYLIDAVWSNVQYIPVDYGTPDPSVTKPKITVLSPQTLTYNTSSITINFTVDKPTSWLSYTVDGKENVTITGNTTLTDLPDGVHSIMIWANDTYGNTASSQTITVHINTPFPSLTQKAIIGGVVACAIAVAVAGYIIKIRAKKNLVS